MTRILDALTILFLRSCVAVFAVGLVVVIASHF